MMKKPSFTVTAPPDFKGLSAGLQALKRRDPKYKDADVSCLKAIAQAAINVELFTIPLYMVSLYSVKGMHQITSKGNNFYAGRFWPGAAPFAKPANAGEQAFNLVFSVFVEEMLHLQLASNMATVLGTQPNFNSPLLQNPDYGWNCYNSSVIPHILDFKDCVAPFDAIRVKLDALNQSQVELFLAIEETEERADHILKDSAKCKYFQCAPFEWWRPNMTEADLPLFGSIGWMYTCMWDYIEIVYTDGVAMLDLIAGDPAPVQQDLFNVETPGSHPKQEYPGIGAVINPASDLRSQFLNIINGITDQGEGAGVVKRIIQRWHLVKAPMAIQPKFQADAAALREDYPGYDAEGHRTPVSGNAEARAKAAPLDHFERFSAVQMLLAQPDFVTWDQWHDQPGNKWTPEMLIDPRQPMPDYDLPKPEEIAAALNEVKEVNPESNYNLLSRAAVGSLKGITTQLNDYWQNQKGEFPFPAMGGSGDRVSICWAITGKGPNLALGVPNPPKTSLNHACQAMDLSQIPTDKDVCAAVEIYHSCKGSNTCKTEGGCGFVQNSSGGGNCSSKATPAPATGGGCGLPTMSAPANNSCGGNGGCAVPISASQLFPTPGQGGSFVMQLFNFGPAPDYTKEPLTQISYDAGESVYGVAWRAYTTVMKARFPGREIPANPPKPSALRLAFPPST